MNANEIYKNVCEMLNAYDNATGNAGSMNVIKNPHFWANDKYAQQFQPFYSTAAKMLIDCGYAMDAADKKTKSILPAIKRMVKAAKKYSDNLEGFFETADLNGNTRYTLLNGHWIIRLNEDIASVKHLDPEKGPRFTSKSINDLYGNRRDYSRELKLPTAAEVKKTIAAWKAENRATRTPVPAYSFGEIWVNASYLLDMIEALPGARAYTISGEGAYRHPILIEAENGDAILLPINRRSSNEKATA